MEEIKKYRFDEASPVIPRIRFRGVEYLLRFKRYRYGNRVIYLESGEGTYAELTIEIPNIALKQDHVLVRQEIEGVDIPELLHRAGFVERIALSAVRGEAAWLCRLSAEAVRYITYQNYILYHN